MVELKIKLDKEVGAIMPSKANPTDSGYDLTATSVEWNDDEAKLIYHTGVYLQIPEGHEVEILPRSSTSKYDLFMPHSKGLIDEIYRKELLVVYKIIGVNRENIEWARLDALGSLSILLVDSKFIIRPKIYKAGDVIAQMKMGKKLEYVPIEVDNIEDTGRGGFGSTDVAKALNGLVDITNLGKQLGWK